MRTWGGRAQKEPPFVEEEWTPAPDKKKRDKKKRRWRCVFIRAGERGGEREGVRRGKKKVCQRRADSNL